MRDLEREFEGIVDRWRRDAASMPALHNEPDAVAVPTSDPGPSLGVLGAWALTY